jgi:hypothetical protein
MRSLAALLILYGTASQPPSESEALIAAVLQRASTVEDSIPDSSLLGSHPWRICEEIGGSPLKLPGGLDRAIWRPMSGVSLGRLADLEKRVVHFVALNNLVLSEGKATIEIGVEVSVPKPSPGKVAVITCCGFEKDEYEKRGGRWTYSRRVGLCSY